MPGSWQPLASLAHGRYDLRVVANGIASREVEVRVS